MVRITQREIKRMIATGEAIDVSAWSCKDLYALASCLSSHDSYSVDTYGINGVVVTDGSGCVYASPARNSATFILS